MRSHRAVRAASSLRYPALAPGSRCGLRPSAGQFAGALRPSARVYLLRRAATVRRQHRLPHRAAVTVYAPPRRRVTSSLVSRRRPRPSAPVHSRCLRLSALVRRRRSRPKDARSKKQEGKKQDGGGGTGVGVEGPRVAPESVRARRGNKRQLLSFFSFSSA